MHLERISVCVQIFLKIIFQIYQRYRYIEQIYTNGHNYFETVDQKISYCAKNDLLKMFSA